MKPEVRADLHRRTLEALNGTRPEGRAAPGEVPVDRYLDRDRADRERALMWKAMYKAICTHVPMPPTGGCVTGVALPRAAPPKRNTT